MQAHTSHQLLMAAGFLPATFPLVLFLQDFVADTVDTAFGDSGCPQQSLYLNTLWALGAVEAR